MAAAVRTAAVRCDAAGTPGSSSSSCAVSSTRACKTADALAAAEQFAAMKL
jgi:hypothetical protein